MSKNRRGDRVDNSQAGGAKYNAPNRMLPRLSDRDYKAMWYNGLLSAVIPSVRRDVQRRPTVRMPIRRFPAKQPKASKAMSLQEVSFQVAGPVYRASLCVSRKSRREVLFAKGRAGFSGSAPKSRYRRTAYSKYGC